MSTRHKLLLSAVAILFCFIPGCRESRVSSTWRTGDIVIDGVADEWIGKIVFTEWSKAGIGVANDSTFLYLCITSDERTVAGQALMSGFTVMFESKSQQGKKFGVRFPFGHRSAPRPVMGPGAEFDPEEMGAQMEAALQMLAVIGPGKQDTLPMPVWFAADSLGITVAVTPSRVGFVYELKVPLARDSKFAYGIGAGADSLLTITLQTDKMERPTGGPPGGGGGKGGSRCGGGGMGGSRCGGGGKGGPPGGSGNMPEPFKMQCQILLARK
jgi:hypothetical protein